MCESVCLLWCVLQFRTLKGPKIPVGRRNPGAECRWRDHSDILVLTDLPLSLCPLSSLSCSLSHFFSILSFFYLLLPFPLFCSTDSVRITIYLHPQPLSLSRPPLYSPGRALLVLSADVVLLPVWAPERPVGHPSGRLGQGGARPGAVRDVTAAGAAIHQCPSLLQETPASQVLPYLHISVIWIKLLDSLQSKLMTVINLAEHFSIPVMQYFF